MNMKHLIIFSLLFTCGLLHVKAQDPERVEFDWLYWDEADSTPHKGFAEIERPDNSAANLRITFLNDKEDDVSLIVDKGFDYKANLNVVSNRKQKFGPCFYLPQDKPTGIPELGLDRFWIKFDKKTKDDVITVQVEKRQSGRLMGRPRIILSKADDVMNLVAGAIETLNLNLLN